MWKVIIASFVFASCSDVGAKGDTDGGGGSELRYKPCATADKVGEFRVELAQAFTGVSGAVREGVVPSNVPDLVQTSGSCQLLRAPNLFCDPACGTDQTCGTGGTCVPYPKNQDVGTVTLTGMKDPVEMQALAPINVYMNTSSLSHPGFDEGATIGLRATGGEYESFSLGGFGIAALSLDLEAIPAEDNQPVAVAWEASSLDGPTSVNLVLNINHHGGTLAWIECEVEDTGSFAIPADLVTALFAVGASGFPSLVVSRRSADSTTIAPGCVELQIVSEQEIDVEVNGLTSCTDNTPCTPPETCQADLTCG